MPPTKASTRMSSVNCGQLVRRPSCGAGCASVLGDAAELSKAQRLRSAHQRLNSGSCTDDLGTPHQMLLSDTARLGARTADPDPPSARRKLRDQVTQRVEAGGL